MTLDELTEPLTVDEVKAAIYAALASQGVTTTGWKAGAVVRTIIAGLAIVLAAYSRLQASIAKSGFLELAEKDWLTLVALHVYGVTRDPGSFATGVVRLTNNGGGVFSGVAGDVVLAHEDTGKTYRNIEPYALGAGPGTFTDVIFEAVELGTDSNALPNKLTAFVTPLLGVTADNAGALIGTDEETDPALRIRCREKLGSLSPMGPLDAYAYAAKTAKTTDGTSAGVTRVRSTADGVGGVAVVVGSASGPVTGSVGDPTTALGAVDAAIQALAAPLGITATVTSAVALEIDVTYELWVSDTIGLTDSEIEAEVEEALELFMSTQAIGGEIISPATGKVYGSAIGLAIGATKLGGDTDDAARLADETVKLLITVPGGDTSVALTEAPVIGVVTATIHQIASPT